MTPLERHYAAIARLGCICCRNMGLGFVQAELHHPYGRKGENERKVIPTCFSHHRSGVRNVMFVSRHPWKREWIKRYGTEEVLLKQVEELMK